MLHVGKVGIDLWSFWLVLVIGNFLGAAGRLALRAMRGDQKDKRAIKEAATNFGCGVAASTLVIGLIALLS